MIEALSVSPTASEPSGRKLGESRATPEGDPEADFAVLAEAKAPREGGEASLKGDPADSPVRPGSEPRRGFVDATLEAGRMALPAFDVASPSVSIPVSGLTGAEPAPHSAAAGGGPSVTMQQMIAGPSHVDGASRDLRASVASSASPTHLDASTPGDSAETHAATSRPAVRTDAVTGDRWSARRSAQVTSPAETAEGPPASAKDMRGTVERPPSPGAEGPAFKGTEALSIGAGRTATDPSGMPRRTDAVPAPAGATESAATPAALVTRAVAARPTALGDAERTALGRSAAPDSTLAAGAEAPSGGGERDRQSTWIRPTSPGGGEATPDARSPAAPGDDVGALRPVVSAATVEAERLPGPATSSGAGPAEEAAGAVRADLAGATAATAQMTSGASGGLGAPPQGRPVAEEAALRIVAAVDGRGGPVELRLDPPELGLVRVSLSASDGATHALVIAERPETADLLRRHAELLSRELASAGQGRVDVEVSTGGRGGFAREDGGRSPPNSTLAAEGRSDPAAALRPMRSGSAGGLDLRL
ncbi:MAG: flagellar hook-length control protein FliK [Paracoccaceae bacterium]